METFDGRLDFFQLGGSEPTVWDGDSTSTRAKEALPSVLSPPCGMETWTTLWWTSTVAFGSEPTVWDGDYIYKILEDALQKEVPSPPCGMETLVLRRWWSCVEGIVPSPPCGMVTINALIS